MESRNVGMSKNSDLRAYQATSPLKCESAKWCRFIETIRPINRDNDGRGSHRPQLRKYYLFLRVLVRPGVQIQRTTSVAEDSWTIVSGADVAF
jgi:hypothetical protein